MNRNEFFGELETILGSEPHTVGPDTVLEGRLDSLGTLMVIALADEQFHVALSADSISKCKDVSDLMAAIGTDKFEA